MHVERSDVQLQGVQLQFRCKNSVLQNVICLQIHGFVPFQSGWAADDYLLEADCPEPGDPGED